MSDILDVLNIKSFPQKKSKEAQQQQHNNAESKQIYTPDDYATSTKRRKLSAMNRELYNLIGSNVPSLAIDTASVLNAGGGKKFKEKLVNTKKNAPWRHLGFKNSARTDGLVLYHWTKSAPDGKTRLKESEAGENVREEGKETEAGKEPVEKSDLPTEENQHMEIDTETKEEELDPNEYRYAKYNTRLDIPTFTEEEYEEAMKIEEEKKQKELEAKLAKEKAKQEKEKEKKKEQEKEKEKEKEQAKAQEREKEKEKQKEKEKEQEKEKEKENEKKQEIKSASEETPQVEKVDTKEQDSKKTEQTKDSEDSGDGDGDGDLKSQADKEKSKKEESAESDTRSGTEISVKSATESNAEEEAEDKDSVEKQNGSGPKEEAKRADGKSEENVAKEEDGNSKVQEPEETSKEAARERAWTYAETKFLFDLCSKYDMRWSVIFDRYQDEYMDRTLEDLKVQMYTLSAHLLEKRGNLNDSALIKALRSFNKEKELERKYYLTKLIHRAPTEIAEEESLVIEARKFELAAKKMLLERAQLLQLLDSPQSSASVQQYLTSQGLTQLYNSLMSADKSRKRKAEVPVAPLLGPNAIPHTQHLQMSSSANNGNNNANGGTSSGNGGSGNKRRSNGGQSSSGTNGGGSHNGKTTPAGSSSSSKPPSKLSEVQQLLQKNLTEEELEVYGIEIHSERIQPGVHVRSQKIASFKPSVQAKVHEILGQLGLSVKPTMPTGPVSKKFDELLYKIAHLVDLKKQSDKLLAEIELVKRQKGIL